MNWLKGAAAMALASTALVGGHSSAATIVVTGSAISNGANVNGGNASPTNFELTFDDSKVATGDASMAIGSGGAQAQLRITRAAQGASTALDYVASIRNFSVTNDGIYDFLTFSSYDGYNYVTFSSFGTIGLFQNIIDDARLVPTANLLSRFPFITVGFQEGLGDSRTDALSTSTFAVRTVGAVPEPATWAMLFVGFGMIGAASRNRGRSSPAATTEG